MTGAMKPMFSYHMYLTDGTITTPIPTDPKKDLINMETSISIVHDFSMKTYPILKLVNIQL